MIRESRRHAPDDASATHRPDTARGTMLALRLVTLADAALYFVAAILHWGARIRLGPMVLAFPAPVRPASIAEATIGVALTVGAVALLARLRSTRIIAWTVYVFALVGTLFGLTIALLRGLPAADRWIHVVMLTGLAVGFILLWATRPRLAAQR
jgi:hypothetical protein